MCGIAGFHLKKEGVVKRHDQMELFVDVLLSKIEMRGKQATGFVAVTNDSKFEVDKRPVNAAEFIKERKRLPANVRTFAGHTRYATQGSNENNGNLHPVVYGSCFLTHNGGIWNDDELFKEHDLERHAEVDTEVIAALIHKFGWENAAKALHELRGSFAIAALDMKHPGEVLLAKGDYSPLFWHETPNFVVWASSHYAIQDAWKEVLGTPPKREKFGELGEGDMLWLKGGEVEPAKFELAAYPFRRADNPAKRDEHKGGGQMRSIFSRQRNTSRTGNDSLRSRLEARQGGERSTSGSARTARGVIPDRSVAVAQLRADGNGKAILHRNKPTHEELLKICRSNVIFRHCGGCNELVLHESFVHRMGEGRICEDCNYIADWGTVERFVIDEGTLRHLNSWARKESQAHAAALWAVCQRTKMVVTAIDYLVFRVPEDYLDKHPNMADLAVKLDDLYQEAYKNAFDGVLDESLDNKDEKKDETVVQHGSEDKPWHTHHPATESYVPQQCKDCRKYVAKDKPCAYCARTKVEKAETNIDLSKCWCGEPADKTVGGIIAFCLYHYNFCNDDDCQFGISKMNRTRGTIAHANHLLTSGKRVCHYHARSQPGAFSDTTLRQKGVKIRDISSARIPVREVREPGGL